MGYIIDIVLGFLRGFGLIRQEEKPAVRHWTPPVAQPQHYHRGYVPEWAVPLDRSEEQR